LRSMLVSQPHGNNWIRQLRQLEAQVQKQLDVAELASGIVDFCERIQQTLLTLTFQQRRELVTLLVDRVVVDDEKVEIRYVIPTSPRFDSRLAAELLSKGDEAEVAELQQKIARQWEELDTD